jgi:hypothetical protein
MRTLIALLGGAERCSLWRLSTAPLAGHRSNPHVGHLSDPLARRLPRRRTTWNSSRLCRFHRIIDSRGSLRRASGHCRFARTVLAAIDAL